jgi:hypothetical protein
MVGSIPNLTDESDNHRNDGVGPRYQHTLGHFPASLPDSTFQRNVMQAGAALENFQCLAGFVFPLVQPVD